MVVKFFTSIYTNAVEGPETRRLFRRTYQCLNETNMKLEEEFDCHGRIDSAYFLRPQYIFLPLYIMQQR